MTDQEHQPVDLTPYRGPAGGQGSLKSVAEILTREKTLVETGALMLKQNKTHGFMCVSCAWAKPGKPHTFEYCENGAKATAWELTPKTIGDAFFAAHSVSRAAHLVGLPARGGRPPDPAECATIARATITCRSSGTRRSPRSGRKPEGR